MREAMLYEKLPGSQVRCHVCQWRCVIAPGRLGVCRRRRNNDGVLHVLNYAQVSSVAADPIEKKPLFHYRPGSLVFSLGGWGCNFHCIHCQNWEISCSEPWEGRGARQLLPEAEIELTQRYRCQGVAWTYNEPGIWLEYTLDSARLAKEKGLYTVYVTNGFSTPEALDVMGPYLDVWRVDIKGFSDQLYRSLAKVQRWRGILEVAERAFHHWNMHLEVVTNIIPTLNDDEEQLKGIAAWIRDKLSELVPWHVTRFHPMHRLKHLPPTPVATLEHAYKLGKESGLRFVYLGNVPGHPSESTLCYSCGQVKVERYGYQARLKGVTDSKCAHCGAELYMKTGSPV
ncbi:MAG TPA: AmmeMemoRadiSam system radical SAM enzyme [Dehalococcoidia bacterium]|jgi:pyruvate formate lyase activating enzyme|nr:AmmeMemoRadiSam system radical SAM enzyme [Dehalococcoidia bacterium]